MWRKCTQSNNTGTPVPAVVDVAKDTAQHQHLFGILFLSAWWTRCNILSPVSSHLLSSWSWYIDVEEYVLQWMTCFGTNSHLLLVTFCGCVCVSGAGQYWKLSPRRRYQRGGRQLRRQPNPTPAARLVLVPPSPLYCTPTSHWKSESLLSILSSPVFCLSSSPTIIWPQTRGHCCLNIFTVVRVSHL